MLAEFVHGSLSRRQARWPLEHHFYTFKTVQNTLDCKTMDGTPRLDICSKVAQRKFWAEKVSNFERFKSEKIFQFVFCCKTIKKHGESGFKFISSVSLFVHFNMCIYLCSYLCVYASTYECIYLWMYLPTNASTYVCNYLCMYLPMYVSTYVCIYLCIYLPMCVDLFSFPYFESYYESHEPS